MQEHKTFPGKVYAVTCASGCTITDNAGRTLGECEPGKQTLVVATSDKLLTSAAAHVLQTFNSAPAKLMVLGLLGGGEKYPGFDRQKYAQCVTVADMKAINASYLSDLTEDGKWVYSLKSLQNGTRLFFQTGKITGFDGSLESLTNAREMFCDTRNLNSFKTPLNELVDGYGMFWGSAIHGFTVKLPKLKRAVYFFCSCHNILKFEVDMPSLEACSSMFALMNNFESFKAALPALRDGKYMFYKSPKFTHFESALPQLNNGVNMFTDCQLDKESALRVLKSIPSYSSGTYNLTLGIHVDHKTDEAVIAAIDSAEAKGWTLEVQWNGTATAQTASTFGLRSPSIYAKLGSMTRPDGRTEQVLDWGHYVTNAEENGYMEFSSMAEAREYFGLPAEQENILINDTTHD